MYFLVAVNPGTTLHLLGDLIPVQNNAGFRVLFYVLHKDMLVCLVSITIPVVFEIAEHICQCVEVALERGPFLGFLKFQYFLLCFVDIIQLFLYIHQGCRHKQHGGVAAKGNHSSLATAHCSACRLQRPNKSAGGREHLLSVSVDKIKTGPTAAGEGSLNSRSERLKGDT